MEHGTPGPLRRYLGFAGLLLAAAAALVVLGWAPSRALGGGAALAGLLAGVGISVLASLAGGLPIALARRPRGGPTSILAAMALRLAVALAGGLLAVRAGGFAPAPLLVWLAISYLALLAADARYAAAALRGA